MEEIPIAFVTENTPMLELLVGGNLECTEFDYCIFRSAHNISIRQGKISKAVLHQQSNRSDLEEE